jgi:hypothetical protein
MRKSVLKPADLNRVHPNAALVMALCFLGLAGAAWLVEPWFDLEAKALWWWPLLPVFGVAGALLCLGVWPFTRRWAKRRLADPEGYDAAVKARVGPSEPFRIKTSRRLRTVEEQCYTDGTVSIYLTGSMLQSGSVAVGDAIQIEGSTPPVIGEVVRLWLGGRAPQEALRVTAHGRLRLFNPPNRSVTGVTVHMRIAGLAAADLPAGAWLVSPDSAAPPGIIAW